MTAATQDTLSIFESVGKSSLGPEFIDFLKNMEVTYMRSSLVQENDVFSRQFQGRALAIRDLINTFDSALKRK